MLEIVPFHERHWAELTAHRDLETLTGIPGREHLKFLLTGGISCSALVNGELIASGGVFILWPGTGEAWCMVLPKVFGHGVFFGRASRKCLDEIAAQKKLRRVQASVEEGFTRGTRFVETLGFRSEGLMEQYFNGKNFIRYAKIYG
jgi:RimJ/RimL family protein N-acetyltransferase